MEKRNSIILPNWHRTLEGFCVLYLIAWKWFQSCQNWVVFYFFFIWVNHLVFERKYLCIAKNFTAFVTFHMWRTTLELSSYAGAGQSWSLFVGNFASSTCLSDFSCLFAIEPEKVAMCRLVDQGKFAVNS